MNVTYLGNQSVAENIKTFNFKAGESITWIAGQFIQMILPHNNPDDRGIKRWFTVSASPTEGHLSITTKFAGDKTSSFKKTLAALKPGASIEMVEPEGDFTLPDDKNLQLIFIAGGMGITPYHSMVKYLADTGEKRTITLLYGVQTEAEACFLDLFKSYGVDVKLSVGQRFTAESLMTAIGDPANRLMYLSGPEPMVEALDAGLKKAGLPELSLKSDYFPGYENLYSS